MRILEAPQGQYRRRRSAVQVHIHSLPRDQQRIHPFLLRKTVAESHTVIESAYDQLHPAAKALLLDKRHDHLPEGTLDMADLADRQVVNLHPFGKRGLSQAGARAEIAVLERETDGGRIHDRMSLETDLVAYRPILPAQTELDPAVGRKQFQWCPRGKDTEK